MPYSPFFLEQVRTGNVIEITSKGTAIQGTFAQPASNDGSDPTTSFKTEIPAFADTPALSRLLSARAWWRTLALWTPVRHGGPAC